MEKCGFVTHLAVLSLGAAYAMWLGTSDDHSILPEEVQAFVPPRSLAVWIPTFLISGFFAVPYFYFCLNTMSVAPVESMDNVCDVHSRPHKEGIDGESRGTPDIADLDVAEINERILCRRRRLQQRDTQS